MSLSILFAGCFGGESASDAPVTNNPGDTTTDTAAPVPGNSGLVTSGSITANSAVLSWEAGSDTATAQLNLSYAVYISTGSNISTVDDCAANGTEVVYFTTGMLTYSLSNLTSNTTYYYNVVVKDSSGNKACYGIQQLTTSSESDTTAPVAGNSGTITASSVTANSLVLNWTAATDNKTAQVDLQYTVYRSASSNISTVSDCETNGIRNPNYNLTTFTAGNLNADTTYYYNVVVSDSAGNKTCYTAIQQKTSEQPDTTVPVVGNQTITVSSVTANSLVLSWTAATDNKTSQVDLQYAIYMSLNNNIYNDYSCETNGTKIQDYTSGITSVTVSNLTPDTRYYFNIVVKDSAGNKAFYSMIQELTPSAPDTIAPVAGNSGTITASPVTSSSLVLNWTAATDNKSAQSDLQYAVYQSAVYQNPSSNINSVSECETTGTRIQNYTSNLTTLSVSSLDANTTYYFNVVVKDSAGNKACYTSKLLTTSSLPDTTAPVPGNSGTITADSITDSSIVLNWSAASDGITEQPSLQYAVYQSASSNISTVTDCEINGTRIQDYTNNLTTLSVSNLAANTTYYFNIIVKDSAGNKALYTYSGWTTNTTSDITAPIAGGSGTITADSVTSNSLVLSWAAADDDITQYTDLQYAIYQSASNNISTVSDCYINGTLIQSFTANLTTLPVSNLTANTTYYFNIVVTDSSGNRSCYTMTQQTTSSGITPFSPGTGSFTIDPGTYTFTSNGTTISYVFKSGNLIDMTSGGYTTSDMTYSYDTSTGALTFGTSSGSYSSSYTYNNCFTVTTGGNTYLFMPGFKKTSGDATSIIGTYEYSYSTNIFGTVTDYNITLIYSADGTYSVTTTATGQSPTTSSGTWDTTLNTVSGYNFVTINGNLYMYDVNAGYQLQ